MSNTKDGFQEFYLETCGRLLQYVSRMRDINGAAEDVMQETYCLAYMEWEKLQQHTDPMGWLCVTSNHVFRNLKRRMENRNISYEEMDERHVPGYMEEDFNREEWCLTAREMLNEKDWRLLECYIQEYSSAEIAERMGISEENVRMRISRIRKRLRSGMAEQQ